MMKRPIQMSHDFLAQVLDDGSIAVDATMGNGNDTAFLAGLAKKVYAFDVQEQALEKTSQRLSDLGIDNAELILDGHENLDRYVTEPIRAAIFNLGYLPSADKTVIGLDQRVFTAMLYQPLNQINTPPFLVMLEKLQ